MYRITCKMKREVRKGRCGKMFSKLFIAILGLSYISVPIYAAPNGLNVIPTTDIYDSGQISLELQSDGSGARLFSD